MADTTLDDITSGRCERTHAAKWIQLTGTEVVVRGSDGRAYITHPKIEFTEQETAILSAYLESINPEAKLEVLPEGMCVIEVLASVDPSYKGVEATTQESTMRLTTPVSFVPGDLKGNFERLRDHYGLNEGGNHKNVSSLIAGFTITFSSGSTIEYNIPDNDSSKPGLLLYFLSKGQAQFDMDDSLRVITRTYFGDPICNGTETGESRKYTPVARALLERGVTIEIRKANKS